MKVVLKAAPKGLEPDWEQGAPSALVTTLNSCLEPLILHDMDRSLIMPQAVIGCDFSRALIDICELLSGQIANTPDAIAASLARESGT